MFRLLLCEHCGRTIEHEYVYIEAMKAYGYIEPDGAFYWMFDDLHFCSVKCFAAWLSDIAALLRANDHEYRG